MCHQVSATIGLFEDSLTDDWLKISSLEHHAYCPWQARLLIDGVWADNHLTVQGSAAHEHVDQPGADARRGARFHRRVDLASARWRIYGVADAIEERPGGTFLPIEHKWGRGAGDLAPSFIQAAAQALCLEEMLGIRVEHLAVYIVTERQRVSSSMGEWRSRVEAQIACARRDLYALQLGPAQYQRRRCRGCSVFEACQPVAAES